MFGGGYYVLEWVQQLPNSESLFYDIYILLEDIKNNEHLHVLKERTSNTKSEKSTIVFSDIAESLTGWARIISYSVTKVNSKDPKDIVVESMWEGHFKNGMKDGYVRGMSAVDGSCSAGIHNEDVVDGKFISFKADGSIAKPEGFYEGSRLI